MKNLQQILVPTVVSCLALAGAACDEASLPEGACTQLQGDFVEPFVIDEDESFTIDVSAMLETESGLCYEQLAAGTEESPAEGYLVETLGATWISNGTEVSAYQMQRFDLVPEETVAGIEEALIGMGIGGRWRVIIPPELAYDETGADGVPPGAILVADLELVDHSPCANLNSDFDASLAIDVFTFTPTGSGLCQRDDALGTGPAAVLGDGVSVQYSGWLIDGTNFDSGTFPLVIGSGGAIVGFDEGVRGMQVGGQRTIIIPSELAYGASGSPPSIPANATLVFALELLSINQ